MRIFGGLRGFIVFFNHRGRGGKIHEKRRACINYSFALYTNFKKLSAFLWAFLSVFPLR